MASSIYLLAAVALLSTVVHSISEKPLYLSVNDAGGEDSSSDDASMNSTTPQAISSDMTTTTVNLLDNSSTVLPPVAQNNETSFKAGDCQPPTKVNTVYACNNQLNSSFTCSNAEYVLSAGKFIPCHSHDDCKPFQQPNDWCNLPWEYKYTNYGCYCDKKIGSCVIEREHRFTFSRQWAYCIARTEYKCDGKTECLL